MKGRCFIVRYADDFDADRFMNVLPKRFEKYDLKIHPDKTKMVMYGRPHEQQRNREKEHLIFWDSLITGRNHIKVFGQSRGKREGNRQQEPGKKYQAG